VCFKRRTGISALQSNRIGAWRAIAAILLDSAMGLAVHTALPAGTGYTTLEFKISFIKGMTEVPALCAPRGKTLSVGRRAATARGAHPDTKGRLLAHADDDVPGFSRFRRERERRTTV